MKFPNAVGLAAGFDKNARAWPAAAALGFGHVEIGTVTAARPAGQPRPRVFRYPAEEAVINRMGFNNEGAEAIAARLARRAGPGQRRIPLGINLGKSKVTPLDQAVEDYLGSFRHLAEHADYLVLNVSSPNTPGLRELQDAAWLKPLLTALRIARARGRGQAAPAAAAENRARPHVPADRRGAGRHRRARARRHHRHEHHARAPGLVCGGQRGRRPERRAAAPALDGNHQLHRPRDRRPAADHRRRRHHG